jgi:hypothetical protein
MHRSKFRLQRLSPRFVRRISSTIRDLDDLVDVHCSTTSSESHKSLTATRNGKWNMSRAAELQVTAAACRQATSLTAHLFFDFKQFVFGVGLRMMMMPSCRMRRQGVVGRRVPTGHCSDKSQATSVRARAWAA